MNNKQKLSTYVMIEKMKPMKTRLTSNQVLNNFDKLTTTNKGKNQDALREEAVKQYENAVANNKKISRFSMQWVGKTLTEKRVNDKEPKLTIEYSNGNIIEIINYKMTPETDYNKAFNEAEKYFEIELKKYRQEYKLFQVNCKINAEFKHKITHSIATLPLLVWKTSKVQLEEDIDYLLEWFHTNAMVSYDSLRMPASGYTFVKANYFEIKIIRSGKMKGASYIQIPEKYKNTKYGIINPKNDKELKNECFKLCMSVHYAITIEGITKNLYDVSKIKKFNDKYDYSDVEFPTSIENIITFEKNNNINISILEYDNEKNIFYIKKRSTKKSDLTLLLFHNEINSHYAYLKNPERITPILLGGKKLKTYNETNKRNKDNNVMCEHCKKSMTITKMKYHNCKLPSSKKYTPKIMYPIVDYKGGKMKLKIKYNAKIAAKSLKRPFVCYADTEASNVVFYDPNGNKKIKHVMNSFCFKTICSFNPKYNNFVFYRGSDAAKVLIEMLIKEKDRCNAIIKEHYIKYKDHHLTDEEERSFQKQTHCYACTKKFSKELKPVRDHSHLTGKYRGALCNACNINFKDANVVTDEEGETIVNNDLIVVFHNLRNYDGHFIIQEAHHYTDDVKVIAQSLEKYMTMSFCNLKFIDSFMFMSTSLEKLVDALKTDGKIDNFNYMKEYWGDKAELLTQKGIYPYSYVKNDSVFDESLPIKKEFYDTLTKSDIKDEDYKHAQKVYKIMNCQNFGDYHDIYLKCDVLLLADIFENFRNISSLYYNLDPCNYISTPSLSWDAMILNCDKAYKKVGKHFSLGLIYDDETREFIEQSKRGGIVNVGTMRHAIANNKYMKNYDKTKLSSFIAYLDANNLYGLAMSSFLPYEITGFKKCISLDKILKTKTNSKIGYFVECDIHVPRKLHDKFKDYPLCPIAREVKHEELSDYQKSLKTGCKDGSKKLIIDLHDKEKYILHYEYLKGIIALGYEVTKVHRVLEFKQSQWLKEYIDLNTELRKKADNDFFKDFFKLMNNAIYGKTNENLMDRCNILICTDTEKALRYFDKDEFKDATFNDDLFLISCHPREIKYNKPSYIGNAILDISKICMFNFHYDYMKKKYGDKAILLYTDTDSLVYKVECEDLYQDMYNNKEYFDLSDVKPITDTLNGEIKNFNSKENKKVLGKMKSETGMFPITEWCALGPKSYDFKTEIPEDEEDADIKKLKLVKKTKGVQKCVLKNEIKHEDFLNTLTTGNELKKENIIIKALKHQLYTVSMIKTCLSAFDDKMVRIDWNNGYPHGYNPE